MADFDPGTLTCATTGPAGVGAAHRGAAFDACRFVIDEVKSRVAIWKHERYADGDVQWLHPDTTVAGESYGREEDR